MQDAGTAQDSLEFDTARAEDGATVLRFAGRLDIHAAADVWDEVLRAAPRDGQIRVEAGGLTYCDGGGMSLLHELASRQRAGGHALEIHGLRDDLAQFLALTDIEHDLIAPVVCPSKKSFPEHVGIRTQYVLTDLRSLVTYVGAVTATFAQALWHPTRVRWGSVLEAATQAGAFALPVVALIGFLIGWVMAFSAAFIMHDYGADSLLAALIGPAMVRELGPLMTCVVLAARSGSAFAAEIGTMKVNEEIDALQTMGIDPLRYLVIPRVLAAVVMTPILTAFANLAGIVGGAMVSTFVIAQPLIVYTNLLREVVTVGDILVGLTKAVIFGVIVAAIGCIRGLQTRNSPSGIGVATTSAVVTGIVFLGITDAVLAFIIQVLGV